MKNQDMGFLQTGAIYVVGALVLWGIGAILIALGVPPLLGGAVILGVLLLAAL